VRQLLENGLKPEDQGRALQLLLQKAAGREDAGTRIHASAGFLVLTAILAGLAALLSVKARTAFEIGKGAASVKRQKQYDRFLRKTIPTFLILGVLASVLGSWLFELIR
jgi:hypothetical protein